jgi:hypothetical protein
MSPMQWKCPTCGYDNPDGTIRCGGGCGTAHAPARLTLTCQRTGLTLRMHTHTQVGRALLRRLDLEEAVYASEPQFELQPDSQRGQWLLKHCPTARNPTFHNGQPAPAQPIPVQNGDTLTLGPKLLLLTITLED